MTEPAVEPRPFPSVHPFLAFFAWGGIWMFLERWLTLRGVRPGVQVLLLLAACLALGAGIRFLPARIRRWVLPRSSFASLVAVLLLDLGMGLFIVRMRGGEVLPGSWLGGPLSLLATDRVSDLGRSLWVASLLVPMAGFAWVEVRKGWAGDRSKLGRWGVVAGAVLLAAASLWNLAFGGRAEQTLAPAGTAGLFQSLRPGDGPVTLPGFRIRLEGMEATRKDPVDRLSVAQTSGASTWAVPVESGQAGSLPGGLRYQVERLIPDALPSGQVVEDPRGPENPAVQVMLGLGEAEPLVGVLYARQPDAWRREEPRGRFAVVYRERYEPSLLRELAPQPPARQTLTLTFLGRTLVHSVRLGETWDLPGFSLTVMGIFPDFGGLKTLADGQKSFFSRSPNYRNPWIQIRLRQAGGAQADLLLSARPVADKDYQDYLARTLPPGMTLQYDLEGAELQERFVLLTRDDAKIRLVEGGRVVRTADLALNKPFLVQKGLSVTPVAQYGRARFEPDFVPNPSPDATASTARPALRLRVWDPATGAAESHWLSAASDSGTSEAVPFLGGRIRLRYQPKGPDLRDLRAQVSVLDSAGSVLAKATLEAQTPLVYQGFRFYLDGWEPGPPASVRILAVRDPGRLWAGVGLLLVVLGGLAGILASRSSTHE